MADYDQSSRLPKSQRRKTEDCWHQPVPEEHQWKTYYRQKYQRSDKSDKKVLNKIFHIVLFTYIIE